MLGLAFRQSGLVALADVSSYELDAVLAGLVRKGVIETQSDPRSPERGQYRFLQALVREVAYSTLARKDRRTRHLAVAAHLEAEGQDNAGSLSGIVAQHLIDALEATSATDPERGDMAARARRLLRTAAELAESLGSPGEALEAVRTALGLEPGAEEATAWYERGARVATRAGEYALCEELSDQALAGLEGDPVAAARVLRFQALSTMSLGRSSEGGELARRGLSLLGEADAEPELKILLLRSLIWSLRLSDEATAARETVLEMARLAEEVQDPTLMVHALNGLATMLHDAGIPMAGIALLERAITLAREERLLEPLGQTLIGLSSEVYPRDLGRAGELATESIEVCRKVGRADYLEIALINAGFTRMLCGDWDLLLADLADWLDGRPVTSSEAGLHLARLGVLAARGEPLVCREPLPDSEDPWEQHTKDLVLALMLEGRGDLTGAATQAAASAHRTFGSGGMLDDFEVLWAPVVELQLRAGQIEEAEAVLALAGPLLGGRSRALTRAEHARLRGMITAARGEDPEADLRAAETAHAAYCAPFLLARTRHELAAWLMLQGRGSETAPLIEQAREAYTRLGARHYLESLHALQPSSVGAGAPAAILEGAGHG